MGYPMTYVRTVSRNGLQGDYEWPDDAYPPRPATSQSPSGWTQEQTRYHQKRLLAGDLRRLELDQRDERHLAEYANRTGLLPEQVRAVLDLFFSGDF